MELKGLKNYSRAYAGMRLIAILSVISSLVFSIVVFVLCQLEINKNKHSIYVMKKDGSVVSATSTLQSPEERGFEFQDHVRQFYKLWYELDQNSYKRNIDKGLLLVGDCGKELYNEYKEQDLYTLLNSKNISTSVEITEVKVNMSQYPAIGYIKGIQTIKRLNGEAKRNMNCTFTIYDMKRSDDNSHGAKIEEWKVVDNSPIK